jgi:hypothetical protein
VILCTFALFLSGYVLQQRTLRDLRAAIKQPPRPSPKIFLPDRFRKSTTELEDGTVVVIDDDEDDSPDVSRQQQDIVIEVKPTVSDEQVPEEGLKADEDAPPENKEEALPPVFEPWKGQKPVKSTTANLDGKAEKPISAAERRRRIKEELMKLSQGEKPVYYQRRLW